MEPNTPVKNGSDDDVEVGVPLLSRMSASMTNRSAFSSCGLSEAGPVLGPRIGHNIGLQAPQHQYPMSMGARWSLSHGASGAAWS